MFKIKKKSIYFNYKMSKNPVSYGLVAGILGGLGFLGYKLFNGEDADQETINNAKKSVNFNIIDPNKIKEIEANESEGQNTAKAKDTDNQNLESSNEADTANNKNTTTTASTNSSDLNINNEAEPESVEVIENESEVKEEKTSNSDLEIEAEEINLEPESEKKSLFQRQDSSINMEDTIDRIVTV